jgi:hypothetical protein
MILSCRGLLVSLSNIHKQHLESEQNNPPDCTQHLGKASLEAQLGQLAQAQDVAANLAAEPYNKQLNRKRSLDLENMVSKVCVLLYQCAYCAGQKLSTK